MSKYNLDDTLTDSHGNVGTIIRVWQMNDGTNQYDVEFKHVGPMLASHTIRNAAESDLDDWITQLGYKHSPVSVTAATGAASNGLSNGIGQVTKPKYNIGDQFGNGSMHYTIVYIDFKTQPSTLYELTETLTQANTHATEKTLDECITKLGYTYTPVNSYAANIKTNNPYPASTGYNGIDDVLKVTSNSRKINIVMNTCTCEIRDLMMRGCKCGHLTALKAAS